MQFLLALQYSIPGVSMQNKLQLNEKERRKNGCQ